MAEPVSATNRYGPIVSAIQVAVSVRTLIQTWQRDYLGEVAALSGRSRGALPLFRSWVLAPDEDRFNEDQLPSCIIVIGEVPNIYRARNQYRATWDVRVGAMVKGKDRDNTMELAFLYAAALRSILVQQRLPGLNASTEWTGERYDMLDFDDGRTLGAAASMFAVSVEDVVDSNQGPVEPSVDPTAPPGNWPTVDPVKINVWFDPEGS